MSLSNDKPQARSVDVWSPRVRNETRRFHRMATSWFHRRADHRTRVNRSRGSVSRKRAIVSKFGVSGCAGWLLAAFRFVEALQRNRARAGVSGRIVGHYAPTKLTPVSR